MGYGAVKYADLKNHRMTDYKFSFESMLSMQGNTAVYLEYAHARIAGISRKARRPAPARSSCAPRPFLRRADLTSALHRSLHRLSGSPRSRAKT